MTKKTSYEIELAWELMNSIEQAAWGTTLALHVEDEDGGLEAADAAVTRLRAVAELRSRRPEPEYEAAIAGFYMEYEEFAVWYSVAYRIRHHKSPAGYEPPTPEQTKAAYERYAMSRNDFY
jgi:hypothetical protein